MKILLTMLMIFIWSETKSQTFDLLGIYQVDWGDSSSKRYLVFNCDSTYRFITHWDFGTEDSIVPPLLENRKWRLDKNNKVILETPTFDFKSFDILTNGNLIHKKGPKKVMIKIGGLTADCSVSYFIPRFRPEKYTIIRLLPGLKMKSGEVYVDQKLAERTTYYSLTDQEYEESIGNIKLDNAGLRDLIMELRHKINLYESIWPVKKVETWDNDQMTVKYFDRLGREIVKN
jgi:hypothetical protein